MGGSHTYSTSLLKQRSQVLCHKDNKGPETRYIGNGTSVQSRKYTLANNFDSFRVQIESRISRLQQPDAGGTPAVIARGKGGRS